MFQGMEKLAELYRRICSDWTTVGLRGKPDNTDQSAVRKARAYFWGPDQARELGAGGGGSAENPDQSAVREIRHH